MPAPYKLHHTSGRFDHALGKAAAIARANALEGEDPPLTEEELRDLGWRFTRLTPTEGRAAGLDVPRKGQRREAPASAPEFTRELDAWMRRRDHSIASAAAALTASDRSLKHWLTGQHLPHPDRQILLRVRMARDLEQAAEVAA